MDLIVHFGNQFIAELFSDIHKKRSIKGRPFDIGTVPQKILKVHVFGNLGYGFPVIQVKHMLDDHCTYQHSGFRAGLPVDLAGLRLLNRPTS